MHCSAQTCTKPPPRQTDPLLFNHPTQGAHLLRAPLLLLRCRAHIGRLLLLLHQQQQLLQLLLLPWLLRPPPAASQVQQAQQQLARLRVMLLLQLDGGPPAALHMPAGRSIGRKGRGYNGGGVGHVGVSGEHCATSAGQEREL